MTRQALPPDRSTIGPAVAMALALGDPDADVQVLPPVGPDAEPAARSLRGHRSRFRRPLRPATVIMVLLVALIPLMGLVPVTTTPAVPDELGLIVVVGADQPVPDGLVTAAEHEAALAVGWLQQQVGRRLRGDVTRAQIVRLPVAADTLRGSSLAAYRAIVAEVRRQQRRPTLFPVVITPISTATPAGAVQPCARGGVTGMVLFLGNCPGDVPSPEAQWGSPISQRIAHELVHGMGAVADCAPHGTTSGHVLDDPADLMYGGLEEIDPLTTAITLDADRDDYFGHDNTGCPEITSSPLWSS